MDSGIIIGLIGIIVGICVSPAVLRPNWTVWRLLSNWGTWRQTRNLAALDAERDRVNKLRDNPTEMIQFGFNQLFDAFITFMWACAALVLVRMISDIVPQGGKDSFSFLGSAAVFLFIIGAADRAIRGMVTFANLIDFTGWNKDYAKKKAKLTAKADIHQAKPSSDTVTINPTEIAPGNLEPVSLHGEQT